MITRTRVRSISRCKLHLRANVSTREKRDHLMDESAAQALDSDDFNENSNARAIWQQHLRHQQHRQWVFDDDDGAISDVSAPPLSPSAGSSQSSRGADVSGNLFVPGASDLEPDAMINNVLSYYSPSLYAYGLFETIDIVENMVLCGLIDGTVTTSDAGIVWGGSALGATVATWFPSPASAWRHRGLIPALMGHTRWDATARLLEWMLRHYDLSVSPLRRASSTFCQNDNWCHFLRGMAAYGLLSSDLAPFLPVVVEAAIKNNLKEHALPGDVRDRAHAVATLLLETAVEYGSPTLLDLSLEVYSQFSIPTDYKVMLRVQQSFGKTGRRANDWALRSSGTLAQAIPWWFRSQFPKTLSHLATNKPTSSAIAECDNRVDDSLCAKPSQQGTVGQNADAPPERESHELANTGGWSAAEIDELYRLTTQDLSNHISSAQLPAPTTSEGQVNPCPQPPVASINAHKAPLFTDSMAPSQYFSSSGDRLGSGRVLLETEVLSHRGRQRDLMRRGVDACASSLEKPIGSGLFDCPPTFNRHLLDHILTQSLKKEM
jgi:hypothetical protein